MTKKKAQPEELSYEAALSEITDILQKLESGHIHFDALEADINRAQYLLEYCQQKLGILQTKLQEKGDG